MPTAVRPLVLVPTYECVGVYSPFSGDDNGNNQATLEYREAGGSWRQAPWPFVVDRRPTVTAGLSSGYGGTFPNPYYKQWRGSLFFLRPNTEYEIRVSYTDPDGVTGSPVMASVRTWDEDPPVTGNTYYVALNGSNANSGTQDAPWQTIPYAATRIQPGDRVLVRGGTHLIPGTPGNIRPRGGTPGNFVLFEAFPGEPVVINGGRIMEIANSYIRFRGFTFTGGSTLTMMDIGGSASHIRFERCQFTPSAGRAIYIRNGPSAVTVSDCEIRPAGAGMGNAIEMLAAGGNHVVRRCRLLGRLGEDGIKCGSPNFRIDGRAYNNYDSDFYDNLISGNTLGDGPGDDCVEFDGGGVNLRVWGNTVRYSSISGLSLAPVSIGPAYAFRNILVGSPSAFKLGGDGNGWCFIYHNTIYNDFPRISSTFRGITNSGAGFYTNLVTRNNIVVVADFSLAVDYPNAPGIWDFDYDLLFSTGHADHIWFGGKMTLPQFQSSLGQEAHGIDADPAFANPGAGDFSLRPGSPAVGRGVVLPGFNDSQSPWPYQGGAPDLGAIESGMVVTTYTLTVGTQGQGNTTPTPGSYSYAQGTPVSIQAIPAQGWRFDHWEGDASGSQNPLSLLMTRDQSVVAVFTLLPVTISISVSGQGTTDPPIGTFQYPMGSIVTFAAIPAANYRFTGWTGSVVSAENPLIVTLTGDLSLIANFAPIMFMVVIAAGPGGSTNPAPGSYQLQQGSTGTITALPAGGYYFVEWQEGGSTLSTANPISVLVDADRAITAVFALIPLPTQFPVTIGVSGQGMTSPAPGPYLVNSGESMTITALPDSGWQFVRWEGSITDTANPVTFQVMADMSITAVFAQIPPQPGQFAVTISVVGQGTTTPAPGAWRVPENIILTVLAEPTTGWRFDHWEGDVVGSNPLLAVQVTRDLSVVAVFLLQPVPPQPSILPVLVVGGALLGLGIVLTRR